MKTYTLTNTDTTVHALVFHAPYLRKASLVHLRPLTPEEAGKYIPEVQASGFAAVGDWSPLAAPIANEFAKNLYADGWVAGHDSCVFLLSEEELAALAASSVDFLAAHRAAQIERQEVETARQKAVETGKPVEIWRGLETCNGTIEGCVTDLVKYMIRGDGTRFCIHEHWHNT